MGQRVIPFRQFHGLPESGDIIVRMSLSDSRWRELAMQKLESEIASWGFDEEYLGTKFALTS